jgi:hypothetical protein
MLIILMCYIKSRCSEKYLYFTYNYKLAYIKNTKKWDSKPTHEYCMSNANLEKNIGFGTLGSFCYI